jgi:OOP family OmpA-OmpF porin
VLHIDVPGARFLFLCALVLQTPGSGIAETICTPGPYVLRFDLDSVELSADGVEILENIIANDRKCGDSRLFIEGFSEEHESSDLAGRRALIVHQTLRKSGMAADHIYIRVLGAKYPRATAAPGGREARNARVEVNWRPAEQEPVR